MMTDTNTPLDNVLSAVLEMNDVILRSPDRQSLFTEICKLAAQQGRFKTAIIWWIDPSEPHKAVKVARVGTSPRAIERKSVDLGTHISGGPALAAMRTNRVIINNDVREAKHGVPPVLSAWWAGIGSCAGFPLQENERVAGALTLFSSEVNAFDTAVVDLLLRLTRNLSFALGNFAREEQRDRAIAALAERENQLRIITDNLPAMISYIEYPDFRYRFMNKAYETFYGRSREDMLGRTVAEIVDPEDLVQLRALNLGRKFKPGEVRRSVRKLRDASGAVRYFQSSSIPQMGEGDRARGFFQLNVEISEQVLAENELRKVKDRFERAVRGSSDAIWDFDLVTGERYFSARYKEMLGYADHELASHYATIASLMYPPDRSRMEEALQRHLLDYQPFDIQCRYRHRNGRTLWLRLRGQAERDEGGRPLRISGSASDVTDKKAMEEQLQILTRSTSVTSLPTD